MSMVIQLSKRWLEASDGTLYNLENVVKIEFIGSKVYNLQQVSAYTVTEDYSPLYQGTRSECIDLIDKLKRALISGDQFIEINKLIENTD